MNPLLDADGTGSGDGARGVRMDDQSLVLLPVMKEPVEGVLEFSVEGRLPRA